MEKPNGGYIETGDESEVLKEQLAYLLRHAADCRSGVCGVCADCRRLMVVRDLILVPFARPAARRPAAMELHYIPNPAR